MEKIIRKIEKNIDSYKFSFQISDEFLGFRDGKDKNKSKEAQWEIDFFNFNFLDGELKPKYETINKDGDKKVYPSLDNFNQSTYKYLENRLNKSTHPILISTYATIFWNSPKKHTKYADKAITAFIDLVSYYKNKDLSQPDEHHGLRVISSIKNAFYIAKKSKSIRLSEIKNIILDLIVNYPEVSKSIFVLRIRLIELMIKERFAKKALEDSNKIICKIGNSFKDEGDFFNAIAMFKTSYAVCRVIKKDDCNKWTEKQAQCYEKMSVVKKGEIPSLGHLDYCEQAIFLYKKTKNFKKIEILRKRYEKIKNNQNFKEISTPINYSYIKKLIKYNEKKSKEISTRTTSEVLEILINNPFLLPNLKEVKEDAIEQINKHPILFISSIRVMDQRNNTPENFFEDSEKIKFKYIELYKFYFEIQYANLIKQILFRTVGMKSCFLFEVLSCLSVNTWYGKNLRTNNGKSYRWIDILEPSLISFYDEYRKYVLWGIEPNFILAIDSLSLKIEGIIRNLCVISKIPTTNFRDDGTTIEADLPRLLQEPRLKEIISEEDIFLIRFVLTEKTGFYLRHKIAHSLIVKNDYHINYINLLFIIILRLGKYKLSTKKV